MIVKGCASINQLQNIVIFQNLELKQLETLIPYSYVREYEKNELVTQEGDTLPSQLHALIEGNLQIIKTAVNGKQTLVRLISAGEIFAAPAIFGNGISPATIICDENSQVVAIEKDILLSLISQTPEISFQILSIFNQRLQQLHNTVHGLISERAIIRLIRLIQYYSHLYGHHIVEDGDCLNINLTHEQISRSIGVTYEESVRLFKKLKEAVSYSRGGKIVIKDWQKLDCLIEAE